MEKLVKDRIYLRGGDAGRVFINAHVAAGLAIVNVSDAPRFVLAHANSGYILTPMRWHFDAFNDAARCVRLLVDQFGDLFDGDVRSIQTLATAVLAAHRAAGAYTGHNHHLRLLDATFDADKLQSQIADIRAIAMPQHGLTEGAVT